MYWRLKRKKNTNKFKAEMYHYPLPVDKENNMHKENKHNFVVYVYL